MNEKQIMEAEVLINEQIADGIMEMVLSVGNMATEARPGQFVNVYPKADRLILPRPISIADADGDEGTLRLVYAIVGAGTAELGAAVRGDLIKISSPLGNGFILPTEAAENTRGQQKQNRETDENQKPAGLENQAAGDYNNYEQYSSDNRNNPLQADDSDLKNENGKAADSYFGSGSEINSEADTKNEMDAVAIAKIVEEQIAELKEKNKKDGEAQYFETGTDKSDSLKNAIYAGNTADEESSSNTVNVADVESLQNADGAAKKSQFQVRRHAVLVGGGVGTAPLLFLAKALTARGTRCTAVIGFRREPILIQELREADCRVLVTTEEPTESAFVGTVVNCMEINNVKGDLYFACGPTPMLEAVNKYINTVDEKAPFQVSLEERMGCGYGVCVGCACDIKIKNELGEEEIVRRKVCQDGPVFNGKEVVW